MSDTENFECVYLECKDKKSVCTFYRRSGCRSDCPHYCDCDYCEHQLFGEYCSSCEMRHEW